MITKNDCILLLTDLQDSGVDIGTNILKVITSPTVPMDVLTFINEHRQLDLTTFYEKLRKNYNNKKSKLYINLIKEGRIKFGSTCSLSVTNDCLQDIYDHMDFFRDKLVLRPSEISNCPEVVRRLGVISMNTAIEADIYGNVNSTHICGTKMMNGIGGSGDFTRSAYISIFSCPSTAKGGCISSIVPMVSHQDHSEHSVNVIITEQGIADLRGKSPMERAKEVIEHCAHPDYKQLLWDYLKIATKGHTSHSLAAALGMHQVFLNKGDMRLTDWGDF